MTIAAACRFPEGVALITDSRATWKTPQFPHFEDRLQKILALDRKVGLAYAGDDIRIPEAVARLLRRRITSDPGRAEPERIAAVLPRIARVAIKSTSRRLVTDPQHHSFSLVRLRRAQSRCTHSTLRTLLRDVQSMTSSSWARARAWPTTLRRRCGGSTGLNGWI